MSLLSEMARPVADRWRELVQRWLSRRSPPSRSVTLDHGKLFIVPSRAGMGFLLVVVLLWLLGTNYENNLVFALTFLLVSLFAVLPVHTFANLSGLQLQLLAARPAFAGDYAEAEIAVSRSGGRAREWIQVYWSAEEGASLDLFERSTAEICVALPVVKRGKVRAPRLRIESRFPLGLFRCWSWVDLDIEFLVYPRPIAAGPLPLGATLSDSESSDLAAEPRALHGGDDFAGLKPYQPGDSLRHLAWKQYAGGRDLYNKEYESHVDARLWLDWDLLGGRDVETRLSNLCHWALQAEREQTAYGLRIPGIEMAPSSGPGHLQRVLTALALFPVRGGVSGQSK
ncbi:Uncharacterized conserved protein, DUF58 family, contains vWF domain [Microbulbifer donghaiensis]|uniref:Uncharacterized conserved protein, DUF58 family, contains vWF domain n=1 Tax=Microbulbifer donghaiensis TaxID=494016 RepID=A0A1M4X8A5_9GAMM|nr:DUF58 domain-containing protein [Microbulbifer donghaiensis]SHE89625.1 Uncharacterized conserved protein, DUF58 family, contains vWF domain [Microbulbifer donghaiensis]